MAVESCRLQTLDRERCSTFDKIPLKTSMFVKLKVKVSFNIIRGKICAWEIGASLVSDYKLQEKDINTRSKPCLIVPSPLLYPPMNKRERKT